MTYRGIFWICAVAASCMFWWFVISSVIRLATWAGVL